MPRAPDFWWQRRGLQAWLFAVPSWPVGQVAAWRMGRKGATAALPVICVGNLVAGGAGKTPTALALVPILKKMDLRPGFLTRGYKGRNRGPVRIDPETHDVAEVGDEALVLAGVAPTVVARDRKAGAALLAEHGVTVIVMDDGFQNPSVRKDLALVAVDSTVGVGNGMVMPAGPLRAPLGVQLRHTDALIVIGRDGGAGPVVRAAARIGLPVLHAHYEPVRRRGYRTKKYLAFAGIGRPEKFFQTLTEAGADVVMTRGFPDHHVLTETQCRILLRQARENKLVPITTEKDMARLRGQSGAARELAEVTQEFPVKIVFDEEHRLATLIGEALAHRP